MDGAGAVGRGGAEGAAVVADDDALAVVDADGTGGGGTTGAFTEVAAADVVAPDGCVALLLLLFSEGLFVENLLCLRLAALDEELLPEVAVPRSA